MASWCVTYYFPSRNVQPWWVRLAVGHHYFATNKFNKRGARRRVSQNKSPSVDINTYEPDQVMSVKYRYVLLETANDPQELVRELPIPPFGVSAPDVVNIPFKAVRLAKVKIWGNYRPEKSMIENTISLGVKARAGSRPIQWSDTATYSHTAYISKKFAKTDPIGFWYETQFSVSAPELEFTLTKGGLLELTFDYILTDDQPTGQFASTGVAAHRVITNNLSSVHRVVGKDNSYCLPLTM